MGWVGGYPQGREEPVANGRPVGSMVGGGPETRDDACWKVKTGAEEAAMAPSEV